MPHGFIFKLWLGPFHLVRAYLGGGRGQVSYTFPLRILIIHEKSGGGGPESSNIAYILIINGRPLILLMCHV